MTWHIMLHSHVTKMTLQVAVSRRYGMEKAQVAVSRLYDMAHQVAFSRHYVMALQVAVSRLYDMARFKVAVSHHYGMVQDFTLSSHVNTTWHDFSLRMIRKTLDVAGSWEYMK
jgi:hypothetical protein